MPVCPGVFGLLLKVVEWPVIAAAGAGVVLVLAGLAWGFGGKLRRQLGYRRATHFLRQNDWQKALRTLEQLPIRGRVSRAWYHRVRDAEAQARLQAARGLLERGEYEAALDHARRAARLLGEDEDESRDRVLTAMLAEVRRQFAAGESANGLLTRVFQVRSPCAEASFWQGLALARQGQFEPAATALHAAAADQRFLDPPLYLGVLAAQTGRPQEALRHLADANRLAPGNPFVTAQLGAALVAAHGDAQLAARALQRALGPDGLPRWIKTPERAWIEGMPEDRSYVRRLAVQYPFTCPLLGNNFALLVRQGQMALGQALTRLGRLQEAADLYTELLRDSPPTPILARGLGQALARLGQYEEAFKHLRFAHDREEPKQPLTAGYLALCAARGKPTAAGQRESNVTWAVRLLGQFDLPGDAEWAGLCSAVFAEARSAGVALDKSDQLRLCDTLASVNAADAEAAAAYGQLAATFPEAVRPEHARLACRGYQQGAAANERMSDLFTLAFHEAAVAAEYYRQRQWDVEDIEFACLERIALNGHGFPAGLGPDYPARAAELMRARSRRQEAAGQLDAALACAEAHLRLAPADPDGYDWLARLCYRRGDLDRAASLLVDEHRLRPDDPLPLLRRAVIEQQRGRPDAAEEAIRQACADMPPRQRAFTAYLGARLALAAGRNDAAEEWLRECLRNDATHAEALACLAALRGVRGDSDGLATLSPAMRDRNTTDACFHYLAAVCHLAAGETAAAYEAAGRTAADPTLAAEGAYLQGLALTRQNEVEAATSAFQRTAAAASLSSDHARARLGRLAFARGAYAEAMHWWTAMDAGQRAAWHFDAALQAATRLAAVQAYHAGDYQQAAERLLDTEDAQLRPLQVRSLFLAGTVDLLERAVQAGCWAPRVVQLLARAYEQKGQVSEAHAVLTQADPPDAATFVRRGVLSLRDNQLVRAQEEFAHALELDRDQRAAWHNLLLTHLSQGHLEQAAALLPRAAGLVPSADERRGYSLLEKTVRQALAVNGAAHAWSNGDAADAPWLVQLLRGLGNVGTTCRLLRGVAQSLPKQAMVQTAYVEASLVQAKALADRCTWLAALRTLSALDAGAAGSAAVRAALHNLLGCASCLTQDFRAGIQAFREAMRVAGEDVHVQQNLALALEWQGQYALAVPEWERYFDLLRQPPADNAGLAFEAYNRLAGVYAEKTHWEPALAFARRAQELRPGEPVPLERLFQLTNQAGRIEDARRVLRQLLQLRPHEPQYELYELDLIRIHTLADAERLVAGAEHLQRRYPVEPRVEDKTASLVGGVIPLLERTCDELDAQMNRAQREMRALANHQINWKMVHGLMRNLRREFQQLRRLSGRCLPLLRDESRRRTVLDLNAHLDRRIERCRSLGG